VVGPKDGGFGFDQSKKYSQVDNLEEICIQCQQTAWKMPSKIKEIQNCECEHCIVLARRRSISFQIRIDYIL